MAGSAADLILGEFPRTLDERFRVAVPTEMVAALADIAIASAQNSSGAFDRERGSVSGGTSTGSTTPPPCGLSLQ